MGFKRGCIYLANFNSSKGTEAGKIRPCLVVQSDLLNEIDHPSTSVLPLTSQLIDDAAPLRYRIKSRENLQADSDIMLDQIRTIDNRRLKNAKLTVLSEQEMTEIEMLLQTLLGME